jgi:hypothetical protein
MLSLYRLTIVAACLASAVVALTEYDAVVLVKTFADSLMPSQDGSIAQQGNSTLFASDVQGRVDIIGE